MEVNEIIKRRRKELGLTLKEVAKELGVSESLISRYESNDVKNMGIDKLIPLAKILECTPAYLMGWENELKEAEKIPLKKEEVKTAARNRKIVDKLDKLSETKRKIVEDLINSYFDEDMEDEE